MSRAHSNPRLVTIGRGVGEIRAGGFLESGRSGHGNMRRSCGSNTVGLTGSATIHSEDVAKMSDHNVFSHIQPDDAPEHTQPEEPKIESNAGNEAEHARNSHLQRRSFHAVIMDQVRKERKEARVWQSSGVSSSSDIVGSSGASLLIGECGLSRRFVLTQDVETALGAPWRNGR
jgi:hypothetical protein